MLIIISLISVAVSFFSVVFWMMKTAIEDDMTAFIPSLISVAAVFCSIIAFKMSLELCSIQ